MLELKSDDDEETVNLASIMFSSYVLLFCLNRKGIILCGFKATCRDWRPWYLPVCPFRWSL